MILVIAKGNRNLAFYFFEEHHMKILSVLLIVLTCKMIATGQEPEFASPVNIPIVLNGNFGELRSNHFHAGIDIKTNGRTGLPIFSIDDAYVSRIVVAPTGYGRAIYLNHPSGYTSVYAHLEAFAPAIEEWVRAQQYEKEQFKVNLFPPSTLFEIKKGQEIALSGNSGSSAGPHLHFELRKTATENPVNPLFFNFQIEDKVKPVVEHLFIYPVGDSSHVEGKTTGRMQIPLVFYGGSYHLKGMQSIGLYGKTGFGVDAIDYIDNNWIKCGIYQLEYWVDNQLINAFELDELSYSTMRYLNSHIDYAAWVEQRRRIHKTYIDPGNQLDIYRQTYNGGLFNFDDGERHKVQIILYDVSMNASTVEFYVESTRPLKHPAPTGTRFSYYTSNHFETDDIRLNLPVNALYTDIDFQYQKGLVPEGALSALHRVHNSATALHLPAELSIKAENIPGHLESKVLIASFDIPTKKYSSWGGEFEEGWVKTSTRNFGDVCIVADTIAPQVRSLSIKNNTLLESDRIRFKIDDELSGISTYQGTIDGHWVLFEYDAKRDLLFYQFDEKIMKGKNHKLRLVVVDEKENTNTFSASFYY